MKNPRLALCSVSLIALSLLTASCVVPGPRYYPSDADDGGYYQGRTGYAPVPHGPRPYGAVALGYREGYRGDPYRADGYRAGVPHVVGGGIVARSDRDDRNPKSKSKHPAQSPQKNGGPPQQTAGRAGPQQTRPGMSGPQGGQSRPGTSGPGGMRKDDDDDKHHSSHSKKDDDKKKHH